MQWFDLWRNRSGQHQVAVHFLRHGTANAIWFTARKSVVAVVGFLLLLSLFAVLFTSNGNDLWLTAWLIRSRTQQCNWRAVFLFYFLLFFISVRFRCAMAFDICWQRNDKRSTMRSLVLCFVRSIGRWFIASCGHLSDVDGVYLMRCGRSCLVLFVLFRSFNVHFQFQRSHTQSYVVCGLRNALFVHVTFAIRHVQVASFLSVRACVCVFFISRMQH